VDEIIPIDMATWERREHYEYFSRMYLPYFNATLRVDVTNQLKFAREREISFYYALIHTCMEAASEIENFRYRIRPEGVVLLPSLRPAFTYLPPGSSLFRQAAVPMKPDPVEFARGAAEAVKGQTVFSAIEGDDIIYFTSNPWLPFTSIHRAVSDLKTDSIPKIAFGQYEKVNGRTEMPMNICLNHMLADGLHVARFLENFRARLEAL